jgi:hypothetical protein
MRLKLLTLFLILSLSSAAQTKKVIFEEITGALCGNCPSGAWIVDSLTRRYPNLIGIALHSYGVPDAMYFAGIDSLDDLVNTQGGAPFGDLDRMKYPVSNSPLYMIFNYINKFDSIAQVRLAELPRLTVSVAPAWDSVTRDISAQINIDILTNLPSADYRVSMYVIEDSVVGFGHGYDQENFYSTSPPGNPFYGMPNPIVGYVHRHVVRAALPNPLGMTGVLPPAPLAGQNFTTTINYILPDSINENRTSLVAFVYRHSPSAANNEIFNAEEVDLLSQTTGLLSLNKSSIKIYPNPARENITVSSSKILFRNFEITDCTNRKIISGIVNCAEEGIDISSFQAGIYFIKLFAAEEVITFKFIKT